MDDDYDLVDAGDGARLERFGPYLVDRPAPGALAARRSPDRWAAADLRFDRRSGWSGPALADAEAGWTMEIADIGLELRPTAAGQLGVYPEHADHIGFLADQLNERLGKYRQQPGRQCCNRRRARVGSRGQHWADQPLAAPG